MKRFFFALAALLAGLPTLAAAKLSAAEQVMVRTVEAERERHVQLLERLVNQNSGSLHVAGVEAVGRAMRAELEPLGFHVRWIPMREVGRAGHLLAVKAGRGKRLLLIGHLDTVFEPDSPFQRFERQGERAIGPGADDNKGGIVVMLSALRAMRAAGTLRDTAIEIVLTGDEEKPGLPLAISRRDLIAAGKRADAALDFEGLARQDGRDIGSIARRSSNSWTVTVAAKSGHSSQIFTAGAGDGAVYELARILTAFRAELPEPNLTFNAGIVAGGAAATSDPEHTQVSAAGKTNIIAGAAIAHGDLRALSLEQAERARARMRAIVARSLPQTTAEIRFHEGGYPAMPPTAGGRALLARLNGVNRDLGLPEMPEGDPARRGAGDIAFVAADVDGLVGLGSAGSGAHAPGESVDLVSLDRQAKRAAILMSRLARERR